MQLAPVQVVELFPEERAALIELLLSLDSDEWWRRSIGDWTIHDVALHLWGGDVNILSGGRDHYNGPPGVQPASDLSIWKNLVGFINNRNADWVSATRRISPPLLIELLVDSGRQLNRYWPSLDLSAAGPTVNWVGNGPMPMWVHVAREFTERWTHQQHIRDAIGKPGMTGRRYLHPVLDTFIRALPYTLRDVRAANGAGVGFIVTGDAGGEWWAVRERSTWRLDDAAPVDVMTAVTLDQDTAWRLLTRGFAPEVAVERATIDGDPRTGAVVLQMVSMIV
jgi:uncharacterized protein (TIGR03083 family)